MKEAIGIFRLHLFKLSETFILNQVRSIEQFQPIFVGRTKKGTRPEGFQAVDMDEADNLSKLCLIAFRNSRLAEVLRARQIRLIHAHFGIDAVYALPIAQSLKVPLIVTLHGLDATRSNLSFVTSCRPALINYVLYKNALKKYANRFVCVSEFIKQSAIRAGFPEEKISVHYIGVDVNKFVARGDVGEAGLVVHVGRLVEKKGTIYLIRAFSRVRERHDSAKLIIVGDGPLKGRLKDEVQRLGLGSSVLFLGALSNADAVQWVRRASVMVVPSIVAASGDAEGLGIVTLEASAQAVPVVAFRSGGIPEAVKDGETGFLVPELDIAGLAERISLLLSDTGLRARMGQLGRSFVERNFSIEKQTRKLERIYNQALTSHRMGGDGL